MKMGGVIVRSEGAGKCDRLRQCDHSLLRVLGVLHWFVCNIRDGNR